MKFNSRIFSLYLILGLLAWVLDALMETLVFRKGTFLEMVLTNVSPEEVAHRVVLLAVLLLFGYVSAKALNRQEQAKREATRRALEDSEEWFKGLAEFLPEPVFEADLTSRVTYANRKAFELFGFSQEDFDAGLRGFELLTPECRERAEEAIRGRLEGQDPGPAEYTALKKDGTTFPILFHASLFRIEGRPAGIRGIIVDISKRKRAEEELRESERRFRNIVNSSPVGTFLFQLDPAGPLVLAAANPAADEILGIETSSLIGKTIEEAFPPLAETEVPTRYRVAAAEGRSISTEQIDYDHGGITGTYDVSAFQTELNEVAVMFLDVTERKRVDEALRESEAQFRNVIEQLNDATYILFDGRFDLVNPRFCELTGVSAEEAASSDFEFWELVAPDSVPTIRRRQEQREKGEEVSGIYEFEIKHRDGHNVQVEASVTEIDYRGGRAILGLLRDMTEQKSIKEQLLLAQKMESVGRLAGGVAHDLNNLLTPIMGYGDLVFEGLSPEDPGREGVQEIRWAARRARDLVRQLLAFGRQQSLEFKAIDLNEMVGNFHSFLERTVRADIEVRFLPSPTRLSILGDRGQLEQVVMNLVVNAQDAMPDGGPVTIEITEIEVDETHAETHSGVRAAHYALLSVSDTGEGMAPETRGKIFEPFFTTKDRGRGTGLGLATVFGIVSQHGGTVSVYSEPGHGSTFKCFLPLADISAEERVTQPHQVRELGGTETVMVVEDETVVLNLATLILKRRGYSVLEADGSAACLEILRNLAGPLHLLLTDVVMPGMKGWELYGEVKKIFPEVRVLYMSGYSKEFVTRRGAQAGKIDFIQKPFTVRGLEARVRRVLEED